MSRRNREPNACFYSEVKFDHLTTIFETVRYPEMKITNRSAFTHGGGTVINKSGQKLDENGSQQSALASNDQTELYQITIDADDLNDLIKTGDMHVEWINTYPSIYKLFCESHGTLYGCLIKGTMVRALVRIEVDKDKRHKPPEGIWKTSNSRTIRFVLLKTVHVSYEKLQHLSPRRTCDIYQFGLCNEIWKQLQADVTNKVLKMIWDAEGNVRSQKSPPTTEEEAIKTNGSVDTLGSQDSDGRPEEKTHEKGRSDPDVERELSQDKGEYRQVTSVTGRHATRYYIHDDESAGQVRERYEKPNQLGGQCEDQNKYQFQERKQEQDLKQVHEQDQVQDQELARVRFLKNDQEVEKEQEFARKRFMKRDQEVYIEPAGDQLLQEMDSTHPTTSEGTHPTAAVEASDSPAYEGDDTERMDTSESSASSDCEIFQDRNIQNSGLRNLGNTCYMNSVLQCLSVVPWERLIVYQKDFQYPFIQDFLELMLDMTSRRHSGHGISPYNLKKSINSFQTRFSSYEQQDAHEFLTFIIYNLSQQLPKSAREIFSDLFCGILENRTRFLCPSNHSLAIAQDLYTVSLPVKIQQPGRVENALDAFLEEEMLDEEDKGFCRECKDYYNCSLQLCLARLPQILILHLKKFDFLLREKLNVCMKFPFTGLKVEDASGKQCFYDLHAVCNHSGSLVSGHYTAYVKSQSHNQESNRGLWHEYNDSSVYEVTEQDIERDASRAYLLIYKLSRCGNPGYSREQIN